MHMMPREERSIDRSINRRDDSPRQLELMGHLLITRTLEYCNNKRMNTMLMQ